MMSRDAFRVFLFFLCVFWLTHSGFDTSETIDHLQVARQIVTQGTLGFDEPVKGVFCQAPNGRTYGTHEIGNAILLIPAVAANHAFASLVEGRVPAERLAIIEKFTVSFQAGVQAALLVAIVFLILTREYGLSVRAGFLGCLALAFGTYYWAFSRSLFDGMLCGLLLVAALWALLRYRAGGSLAAIALAFALLGYSVDTRLSMLVPTVLALGFVVAARPGSRSKALAVAMAALAPFVAWQLGYNYLRTGIPWISPVQLPRYDSTNALDGHLLTGLAGLLVSPGKGLLIYAPLVLVSAVAFPRFWRRDRLVALFIAASGVAWLALHAKLRNWFGAWGWGPRHLITLTPLLVLPALVHLPDLWRERLGRWLVVATILPGVALGSAAAVGNYYHRLEVAAHDGRLDDRFIWGSRSQAVDMFIGAGRNVAVLAGAAEPRNVPGASDWNNYASNRINMWWFTLPHAGVPRAAVALACLPLLLGAVWTARSLLARTAGSRLP